MVIDADRLRNTAPGPMEMVLIGLCACTATDVVIILKKKREPFTAIDVHAEAERAPDPPTVYTRINLVFTVSGPVSRKAVEDAVRLSEEKYCSVAAMLKSTATITTEVRITEPAPTPKRELAKKSNSSAGKGIYFKTVMAIPAKVYPKARMIAVETVLSTVSETRSCAAHRFCHGLHQCWNGYKALNGRYNTRSQHVTKENRCLQPARMTAVLYGASL